MWVNIIMISGIAQADVGPPEEYGEFEMDCPLPGTKFLVNDESVSIYKYRPICTCTYNV